jgi:hypothetical protein
MVPGSDLVRLSLDVIMSRARVRAESIHAMLWASARSAWRRRVGHSATTLPYPLRGALSGRHSVAASRAPAALLTGSLKPLGRRQRGFRPVRPR